MSSFLSQFGLYRYSRVLALPLVLACLASVSFAVEKASTDVLLEKEPKGAVDVLTLKKDAKDQDEVVVVGRIGGRKDPWIKGMAAFPIVDRSLTPCNEMEGDMCKYPWDYCCESNLPQATVLIKFVDDSGKIIKEDPRTFLDVKELQTVVVQGKAQRDKSGNVTVLASKLHVRPDKQVAESARKLTSSNSRSSATRKRLQGYHDGGRHFVSRYVVPGALLSGFAVLVAWASRDVIAPPRNVWVVPVLAAQSTSQQEGTPLFQAAGWIEPRPTPIRVAALAPGVIKDLLVVQDQSVKAGEPIAELVKEDAQLAYELAAATLKVREAEVKDAEATLTAATTRLDQPVHLEAMLGDAAAALANVTTEQTNLPYEIQRAQAQLIFARQDYEGKLSAAAAVSERSIQEAKSVLDAAQATLTELEIRADSLAVQADGLRQRRDALSVQLDLLIDEKQAKSRSTAMLDAARAKLDQDQVALAQAKLRLDRMSVRAPVTGRIYQLVAFPGTTLTAGMGGIQTGDSSTVVTMYQPDMLQVRVDARFEDIPKVSLGQSVQINNPALARPLSGSVLFVSSEANIQKNTLQVKVAIDAPPHVFKPEMLVNVTFLAPKPVVAENSASQEVGLFLPQQVVQRGEGETFVWLADQSAKAARRVPVELGTPNSGGLIEVRGAGLTVGSRIIARGFEGLENGEKIRVVAEEPTDMRIAVDAHPSGEHTTLP